MKVGILSNQAGQVGKSVLALLLGMTYSGTQNNRAVIFGTSNLSSMIEQIDVGSSTTRLNSPNIYSAMVSSASLQGLDMLDYALRVGKEQVYLFDIMAARMEPNNLHEMFIKSLSKSPATLNIIEISGDLNDKFNKRIISTCDCYLYVFNQTLGSIAKLKQWVSEVDRKILIRTKFICQQYDSTVASEKRLATDAGLSLRDMIVFPEIKRIKKVAYDGTLDKLGSEIRSGKPEMIPTRSKLLEIMQVLFDSDEVKCIKGIDKWPRY